MPTPVNTARQCLTHEASITVDDAVAMAGRRGHAQTTSLHYISSLLSVPSSCLREACSRTRNNAYSVRVQFKALDLCLGVSMDRLPSSPSSSKVDYPPVSNSLMAAIKRSQANQRRQPENFNFYQQQLQNQSASSSVPVVKVELRNLIISVLDDPVVSRVFGEAGFRSCDIKLAILRPVHQLFRYSRFKGPPLFLCNLTNQTDRSFSFPFLGFSGGEDDCRRIGEVFVNNRGKNPLILGTCAQGAMNNFLEMIQSNSGGGGGILPVEVYGLSVICIETEIIRFVRGEYDEELMKSKFEEIGCMLMNSSLGSGVVVNYGDLKLLSSNDGYIDSCRYIVSKLTSLLQINHGKLWLIGWVEKYEIYLKVLNRFPYIEKDWELQLLTIISSGNPKEETFPRSRLMESFVPLGGFFSTATGDIKSPLSSSYHTASRCHLCNEKCKQEVNALSKCGLISTASVADHYQSSLPSWLQMTQLNTNGGLDPIKAKDDKMVLGAKIAGLQRKWDNLCQRLHYNQPLPKTSNFHMTSEFPSVVGFQVVEDRKQSLNNENIETRRKKMTCTISSSNESSIFLSKTRSLGDDDHGFNSSTSLTSVTTDLGLCMASTSPSKEQEHLTNDSSINQPHDISCSVEAPRFINRSPLQQQLDPKDFKMLYAALIEKVNWQEEAVNAISQTIARCRCRNERNNCPSRGDIWLNFLGPDKLGKKKIAIALGEILYGSTNNLICVDLSLQDEVGLFDLQVLNQYDVRFRGKHVVDYVADKLRNCPLSVVFLENVDKADILMQKSLSQAVKTGRFLDSHGREVSIGNAIFVTTSSRLDEERTLPSTKETAEYSEEDILAAKGNQIQILIAFDLTDDVKSLNSTALITTRKRSSSQIVVNNRKLITTGPIESVDQQFGSSEMAKRAHKTSNTCLDLNLPAEEIENFTGDSGCDFSNENTTAWLKQLFTQFDETAIFRPLDLDSLAEKLLKEMRQCFHKIVGPECLLEIDSKVVQQILAAACLSDSKKIEDWIQHVLGRGFVQAQERYSLNARSVVKLVTCESYLQQVHIPGVLLPGRIIVN